MVPVFKKMRIDMYTWGCILVTTVLSATREEWTQVSGCAEEAPSG